MRVHSWLAAAALLLAVPVRAAPGNEPGPASAPIVDTDAPGSVGLVPTRPTAAPPVPPPIGALPHEVAAVAREVADLPLPERMKRISELWMGLPYRLDPLGEGHGVDADPLARYDSFDCLTFVEEVLALSLAGDPAHAAEIRLSLRYGDRSPTYAHRRHFMELQWIPGNIEAGWLRPTTAEYGPVVRMERDVSLDTWSRWSARKAFALSDEELPTGPMQLDVLSIDDAIAAAPHIRPGTIVLTVREDRSWKPIWISHVGFVVPGEDEPTVRHATKLVPAGVRDHGLVYYLEKLRTYTKWPVVGISLLEPIEAGPRRSRLP